MMKKDLINKKVVRAISLGLSAVMLTTPMTALAAEGEEVEPVVPTEEIDTVATDAQVAEDAIQDAQDSTKDGIIVLDEAATLPSGTVVNTVPDADDAAGAKELEGVTATVDGETVDYTDVAADETAANEALTDAEVELIKTDASEAAAEVDVTEANDIIEDIEENNDVITDANQKAEEAAEAAVKAAEEADAAVTEAEALEAVDKAEQAVADAEAAQAEAQAAYDENLIKLGEAQAELDAAKANLEAAQNSLTASEEDIVAAEAAVKAAEEKADALKAEVDKEADILSKSQDAALKAAYEKMMAIKNVTNLYDGDSFDSDGVDDEFIDRFGSESAGSGYWDAADDYFELYLKCVYGDKYRGGEWTRKNELNNGLNYLALRDNVFTVRYIDDDGNEATALYNYHTADKDGNISIYEKEIATKTVEAVTEEQTVNVGLSIKNEDNTYTTYEQTKKDTDVVVSVEKDEEGNDTAILVKDDNSQQTANVDDLANYQASLGKNQNATVVSEATTTYEIGEVTVVDSYEKKPEKEKTVSDFDSQRDFRNQVDTAVSEGKVVEISWNGLFGTYTIDANDVNWFTLFVDDFADIIGRGLKVDVYNMVDDTSKPKDTHTEQGIIAKTTAQVTTTTTEKSTIDGFEDTWELKGIFPVCTASAYDNAKAAAEAHKAQLEAQGYTDVSYKVYHLSLVDDKEGAYYTINYTSSLTETKAIATEAYTATSYVNNSYTKVVEIEPEKEVEYWTERKNTTKDEYVKAAIDGVTQKLNAMKEKQDAAAIALLAAQEAKKDVEAAKAALELVNVEDQAYQAALARYNEASTAFDKAKDSLDTIEGEVKEAQEAYEKAAAELGRFVQTPPAGDEGTTGGGAGGTTGGTTPVVPGAEIVDGGAVVTPVATGAGAGAGAAVVDIEDEETPLAAGIDNGNGDGDANGGEGDDVLVAGAEDDGDGASLVAIEDEETPLAAGSGADGKMSWWWLLIVALLGATGYKMYKDHQKKKEEAAQEA